MLKKNRTVSFTLNFDEKTDAKLRDTAKQFEVSVATIIRECIKNDLDKLIQRETKRLKKLQSKQG